MLSKVKNWCYTINLTFLLTINLFLIIAFVLVSTAAVIGLGSALGWLDWIRFVTPANIAIVVYVAAILIGISMVVMIRMVILNPVLSMVRAMKQLAAGDFTVRMSCKGWMRPLELREFAVAFNTAAEELDGTEILRKDFINNFPMSLKHPLPLWVDLRICCWKMKRCLRKSGGNICKSSAAKATALRLWPTASWRCPAWKHRRS